MAQRAHGITKAEFSTDQGNTWTEINRLVAEESSLEPQGPREPAQDEHGNAYWAPKYWVLNLEALDDSAYATLDTEYGNDNKVRLRFDLEDGTTFECDIDILVPVTQRTIEGSVQGRSEGFMIGGPDQDVQIRDDDVTIS